MHEIFYFLRNSIALMILDVNETIGLEDVNGNLVFGFLFKYYFFSFSTIGLNFLSDKLCLFSLSEF